MMFFDDFDKSTATSEQGLERCCWFGVLDRSGSEVSADASFTFGCLSEEDEII